MNQITKGAAAVAASVGGVVVHRVRSVRGRDRWPTGEGGDAGADAQWRVVTVNVPQDQVAPDGRLPEPLARLGDAIEVQIRPAPGDKGTELAARFRGSATDDDIGRLRQALREAKQLVEVGEVLRMDPRPHGERTDTPGGRLLDGAVAASRKEGLL